MYVHLMHLRSPGAGVTVNHHVHARNQTWVLCNIVSALNDSAISLAPKYTF